MILESKITGFSTIRHEAGLCIIGAGAAGLFAAVAAARCGVKVALMHDRPVVGGNASGEIRMWIRGAHGRDNRETGLVEELALANLRRNPTLNFSIWDSVTYEMVINEPNIDLILNCSCLDAEMDGDRIVSVRGWQTTTQQFHHVTAKLFADCSGDSVLAPLTGAEYRMGRESSDEFGEDIAPAIADKKTMGMSCLFQVSETDREIPFKAPDWAEKFTEETLCHRVNMNNPNVFKNDNFWWIELGGEYDSIADTELLRERLLKITFGVWDFFKNSGKFDAKNWELDWVGFLPGKRESRRYVGDYMLTQNDVRGQTKFEDLVAYGGWSLDDHHPAGFDTTEPPNIHHRAPSPYGIPYRCMYSKNVGNLFFAGRNISVTHCAVSSTRVMATCALIGQAVGAAAAIAVKNGLSPRGVYEQKVTELKQMLMDDDCYLPFNTRAVPQLTREAKLNCAAADAENLRSGDDRPIGDNDNGCTIRLGEAAEYDFGSEKPVSMVRIVWDSDLDRTTMPSIKGRVYDINMLHNRSWHSPDFYVPKTMTKSYRIEGVKADGSVVVLCEETNNYQRLNKIAVEGTYKAIRLVPLATWGSEQSHVFAFDVR